LAVKGCGVDPGSHWGGFELAEGFARRGHGCRGLSAPEVKKASLVQNGYAGTGPEGSG
jgi:hypothetical protein